MTNLDENIEIGKSIYYLVDTMTLLTSISDNKQYAEGFENQSTYQITSGDRK